jgi:CHRD domain-containing protein
VRRFMMGAALAAAVAMPMAGAQATEKFHALFSGFNEVGALNAETGAILSEGTATLQLTLDDRAQTVTYKLTFSGLSTPVTQAHIHFGKVHVPGNVLAFLCTNLGNGPAGTPACPANGGTVTGTITAADIVPSGQGVAAGNFDALEDALNSNTAYGNIHTTPFPAGEIRGQIVMGFDNEN